MCHMEVDWFITYRIWWGRFKNMHFFHATQWLFACTVEPLTNDHPHQRPSLSYDHISCDGQWFLFVYESLTSDHPSYTTTPMWFWGWSYKRGSTVVPNLCEESINKNIFSQNVCDKWNMELLWCICAIELMNRLFISLKVIFVKKRTSSHQSQVPRCRSTVYFSIAMPASWHMIMLAANVPSACTKL